MLVNVAVLARLLARKLAAPAESAGSGAPVEDALGGVHEEENDSSSPNDTVFAIDCGGLRSLIYTQTKCGMQNAT